MQKVTVMTPVYNRAHTIDRLYQSLLRQTDQRFDWLIIDDGSTDRLCDLVDMWECDAKRIFEMKYVYRENGGKHRAWNKALPIIDGEWTFVVDSDDFLTDDAIEKIYGWISMVEEDTLFAGVSGKKGGLNGEDTVGAFPKGKKFVDADNLHRHSAHLTGDMAEVYRTSVLRKYPFPEFEGEKFIAENAVFGRIARDGLKLRWFPDVIYCCEYREDGLTKGIASRYLEFFEGFSYMVRESEKYNEFPYDYVWIGRFADIARRRGLSIWDGCHKIAENPFRYMIGMVMFRMVEAAKSVRRCGNGR